MDTSYRKRALCIGVTILVFAVCYVVYQPGLTGPFVFDDLPNILFNPALQQGKFTFSSLIEAALSSDSGTLKRPIAMLSFALNAALGQFNVYYYKLVNLTIHLINGLLIVCFSYILLKRYNISFLVSTKLTNRHLGWVSFIIGIVWLLHPLNITSVLYVVQRMNSLSTLFVLAGLISYMAGREKLLSENSKGLWLILSLPLWTILAALSKENGALLPLYVLLIEGLIYRFKIPASQLARFRWLFACVVVLPIIAGIAYFLFNIDTFLNYRHRSFSLWQRVLTESRVLWFYIYLILIPNISKMGLYHDDFVLSQGLFDPITTLLSVIGILALLAIAIVGRRRLPLISFGILWFFISHSLESSVFPLELVYEHRNYLAQYGIIFAGIFYLLYPFQKNKEKTNDDYARYAFIALYVLLIGYGTHARAQHWHSDLSLAVQETKVHPGSVRANTNLAAILHKKKQYGFALPYFVKAVNLDPSNPNTRIRLMQTLYQSKQFIPDELFIETETILKELAFFNPKVLLTFDPLLLTTTDTPTINHKVVAMYENYINREDANVVWRLFAYKKLIALYQSTGDLAKALPYLERAMQLDKSAPSHYLTTAEIHMNLGNRNKARTVLESLQSSHILMAEADAKKLSELLIKLKQ